MINVQFRFLTFIGIFFSTVLSFAQSNQTITITPDHVYDFNSEEIIVGEDGPIFIDSLNRVFVGDTN